VSEGRPTDEKVQEAAEHAARSVEHRRQMQRSAVQAEATDGGEQADLERKSAGHRRAAEGEEDQAETSAQAADEASGS
jgi:hypothetical protein